MRRKTVVRNSGARNSRISPLGQALPRTEDDRLLTGRGCFIADLVLPKAAHAVLVRSPHAHARLRAIDAEAAIRAPGVLAVITADDPELAGIGRIPWEVRPPMPPDDQGGLSNDTLADAKLAAPLHPILAQGATRYVGEPIALVVAETPEEARDAAERVIVEYEALPCVATIAAALADGAALVWREFPGNTYFRVQRGDDSAVGAAFEAAAHVTTLTVSNNRIAAVPMEPRGYAGTYEASAGRYVLYATAGKPHLLQRMIAGAILGIPVERLRVIARDVGGGFGAKNHVYPEQILVLLAARRLGRPVKWIGERSEAMMSDAQGRDQVSTASLAIDRDGRFLALRVATVANLGAYLSPRGVNPPMSGARMLTGAYAIPAASFEVRAVFTHTVPTAPYRGAGAPEVMHVLERLVDCATRELGMAPDGLRRRNLIPAAAMPYTNALGTIYDSGDFAANLDQALALAEWSDFPGRRAASRDRGRLRGIGLSYTMEATGLGVDEEATISLDAEARATVLIGTMSNGQGHETAYAQIAADVLSLPVAAITVIQGDTDLVPSGNGTGASRSITVGGTALHLACHRLLEQGKRLAARLLQAAPERIEAGDGGFRVAGASNHVTWRDLAALALDPALSGEPSPGGLAASYRFDPTNFTFPNGCHICEVEVDAETGMVEVVGYTAVHDVGRIINRLIVAGQLHGGVVQGLGQALLEQVAYEEASGQMLAGSLLDYALPRADTAPQFRLEFNEVRSSVNPLGAKACGEAGPVAAPPAVINALIDALAPYGIRHIDMPATPLRVWQAISTARRKGA